MRALGVVFAVSVAALAYVAWEARELLYADDWYGRP